MYNIFVTVKHIINFPPKIPFALISENIQKSMELLLRQHYRETILHDLANEYIGA